MQQGDFFLHRKVISSAFAVASLAPAQDGPGFPTQLLAHTGKSLNLIPL